MNAPSRSTSSANGATERARRPRARDGGQALVELSLVLVPFLFIVLGILDVGRGIYVYNGAAEAAREIARVTSVHPGTDITQPSGWSSQMQAVVATQESLVPGLTTSDIGIACTDLAGTVQSGSECFVGTQNRYVQVTVNVPFNVVVFDFLPVKPTFTFTSVSHIQMS